MQKKAKDKIKEQLKNGADWYNAFDNVESYIMSNFFHEFSAVADVNKSPDENLIECLKLIKNKLEKITS